MIFVYLFKLVEKTNMIAFELVHLSQKKMAR